MSARNATKIHALNLEHPAHNGITYEIVTVTPELASEWLGKNHGNRNQRALKIDVYARDISDGNWLFTGESVKFDWDGRLIDGQHRLEAIIAAGISVSILIVRGLDPAVQSVLDTNARRSAADALGFKGVAAHRSYIAKHARIALARQNGYLQFSLDTSIPSYSNSEILDWYAANMDADYSAAVASKLSTKTNVTPGALSYIFLALSRVDGDDATIFVNDIANLRTAGAGDPRFALIRALESLSRERGGNRDAAQIYLFFRAWNAWRGKKRVELLRLSGGAHGVRGIAIPEPK